MLILTRRNGEAIFMKGEDGKLIEVRILKNDRYEVTLGIEADRSVDIHREEVYWRIQQEQDVEGVA
ncbi:MAG: carbon storage regulator [Marinobacterium sp.]|nr:carbon storage regulator [Marinobacterium sp.]